jgi:hypothetical protein
LFSPLDGKIGPILQKLGQRVPISENELVQLSHFVAYLHVRTPAYIRESELRMSQLKSQLGVISEDVKYHSDPPEIASETFVMKEQHSDHVSPRRSDQAARDEVLKIFIESARSLAAALLDLDWTILVASQDRVFIVGDSPFVVVPPKHHLADVEGIGPLMPGATTCVPLASSMCLRLTRHGYAMSYSHDRQRSHTCGKCLPSV